MDRVLGREQRLHICTRVRNFRGQTPLMLASSLPVRRVLKPKTDFGRASDLR